MTDTNKSRADKIKKKCTKFVNYHPPKTMKDWFERLAAFVDDEDDKMLATDHYGEGAYIEAFEKEIAELLGKEKGVFLPSGTMAQQIALRIWSEKTHNNRVVMHPTAHLEVHEEHAYEYLQGLMHLSIPDHNPTQLLRLDQLKKLKILPGTLLLELPQRPIGGQLPDWQELVGIADWAKEHQVKLHLDGARLWETQPFYNKSLAEIVALFDSVYVSFYKGLDGITGSMLLGPAAFIDEAKVWQRRMGGNLVRMFPYVAAAKMGLQDNLPRMADYHERAKILAAALNELEIYETVPTIPQTNMFHLYIRSDKDRIEQAHLDLAEETGMWLINRVSPGIIPAYHWTEVTIGSASNDLDMDEVIAYFQKLATKIRD